MRSGLGFAGPLLLVMFSNPFVVGAKLVKRDGPIGRYIAGALNIEESSSTNSNDRVIDSQSTDERWCQIVAEEQAAILENIDAFSAPEDVPLDPLLAYNCILSVPFVPEDGLDFIDYARQWVRIHSTLDWLVDPPRSYQQPAVDIMGRLDELERRINDGEFTSQYNFDVQLLNIEREIGDTHFGFALGSLSLFSWNLPHTLATISSDGQELPQIYVWEDAMKSANESSWEPSPISTMENQPVVDYLAQFALNYTSYSAGESHATWNIIMQNPAWNFNGRTSEFQSSQLYRGQSVSGSFENGTDFEWHFVAYSPVDLLRYELTTGMAIYNSLVVRQSNTLDRRSNPHDEMRNFKRQSRQEEVESLDHMPTPNYPDNPIIKEEPFNVDREAGHTSGYLLEDDTIGVLVMPTFMTGNITGFGHTVSSFISLARDAGARRVVIDVTGNGGGFHWLGFDAFRRFFPEADVTRFFRVPAIPEVNAIGTILSGLIINEEGHVPRGMQRSATVEFATSYEAQSVGLTLDGNGDLYSSWEDYFGPVDTAIGTPVSHPAQFDFENPDTNLGIDLFNGMAFNFANGTSDANVANDTAAWRPEDIIIITDGNCGSTCISFAGLMKDIMRVKIVTVGGLPTYGPSQSMVGSRGHLLLTNGLDGLMQTLREWSYDEFRFNSTARDLFFESLGTSKEDLFAQFPPSSLDVRYNTEASSLSSADAVRLDSEIPYTFHYEPSDCRLFYTMDMVQDITVLWRAAVRILDGDYDACVRGSTNQRGSTNESMTGDPGFDTSFQAWRSWGESDTWGSRNLLTEPDNGLSAQENRTTNGTTTTGTTTHSGAEVMMPSISAVLAFVLSALTFL